VTSEYSAYVGIIKLLISDKMHGEYNVKFSNARCLYTETMPLPHKDCNFNHTLQFDTFNVTAKPKTMYM
jgi:hypothetical protein